MGKQYDIFPITLSPTGFQLVAVYIQDEQDNSAITKRPLQPDLDRTPAQEGTIYFSS